MLTVKKIASRRRAAVMHALLQAARAGHLRPEALAASKARLRTAQNARTASLSLRYSPGGR